jgi:hypothetical protein
MNQFTAPSQVSPLRSMVLCAVGAIVGLAIAGYGLFTASGTATRTVPAETVAMVNQRPVLRSDFKAQVETMSGQPFAATSRQAQLQVLDDMVREELLVQRSLELDFGETNQDARNALVTAVMQQVTVHVETSQPDQRQLQEHYEAHRARFTSEGRMEVRQLSVPASPRRSATERLDIAQAAATALRAKAPVATVIERFGLHEPQGYEQDYYFAVKHRLGDALFAHVKDRSAGDVSEPLPVGDDIYLVQVISNDKPVPLAFDEARDSVLTDFKDAERARLMDATIEFLRSRSTIRIASDYAPDYRP